ncbi:DUF2914 domain-containing protein [Thermodesulfobacteriota bacterium]
MKSTIRALSALLTVVVLSMLTHTIAFGRDGTSFTVARMVVCEGIENREPVGVQETFPLSISSVYCFLEAKDIDADTEVRFVWSHEGIQRAIVPLQLRKGMRWRTYSSKKLGNWKGNWTVELQDAEGTAIKTVQFTVE